MFISVFGSLLGHFLLGFGVTFCWPGASSFLGARVSGYCCNVYMCHYMCLEFYLSSVWGILISFWSILVFSPTLLSLFYYFLHYYYYLYCCCFYSLLLLLLFPQSSWLCVTGARAGAGYGGRGLVAGLRVGLACGVLLLPGFGVSSSSPQVPGHPTSICDAGVNLCQFA